MRIALFGFLLCLFTLGVTHRCMHHKLMQDYEFHEDMVYDDTKGGRQLLESPYQSIQIQLDFTNIERKVLQKILKTVTIIAQTFFQNTLKVQKAERIIYPNQRTCNKMEIPDKYKKIGTTADYVFMVGLQMSNQAALATCKHCALLKSNNRPIFGGLMYKVGSINTKFSNKIDNAEFQVLTYIAIHQMMHGLVFAAQLFDNFTSSDVEYQKNQSDPFITNQRIRRLTQEYFGCNQRVALGLQQDNGNSHWEEQFLGDQIMTPEIDENTYISELTMEVFAASGWYEVQKDGYFEPSHWGKGKGCDFIRTRNNCSFEEFCQKDAQKDAQKTKSCNFEQTSKATCQSSNFMSCGRMVAKDKINNCYNANFTVSQTAEKGSSRSKCYNSTIRKRGVSDPNTKDFSRCLQSICLNQNKFVMMKIENKARSCKIQGSKITRILGFSGVINCPSNFQRICETKKQCAYSCNQQGICIDGQCLCKDSSGKTSTCISNRLLQETSEQRQARARQSMDCPQNTIFDPITKKCEACSEMLSCSSCDNEGCITCDDGSHPVRGRCY